MHTTVAKMLRFRERCVCDCPHAQTFGLVVNQSIVPDAAVSLSGRQTSISIFNCLSECCWSHRGYLFFVKSHPSRHHLLPCPLCYRSTPRTVAIRMRKSLMFGQSCADIRTKSMTRNERSSKEMEFHRLAVSHVFNTNAKICPRTNYLDGA